MSDPWTHKHRADQAKAKADVAKDEIAQRNRRIKDAKEARETARRAKIDESSRAYPCPKPFWQNG